MIRRTRGFSIVAGCALLGAIAPGCVKRKKVDVQTFAMEIVVIEPLGGGDRTLPDDLIELSLPLRNDECDLVAFTPTAEVVRIDVDPTSRFKLEPREDWAAQLQRFFGSSTWEQKVRHVRRGLQGLPLPGELTVDGGDLAQTRERLRRLIEEKGGAAAVWLYGEEEGLVDGDEAAHHFSTFEAFRDEAGAQLCARSRQKQRLPEQVVVYVSPAMASALAAPQEEEADVANAAGARAAPVDEVAAAGEPETANSLEQIRRHLEEGRLAEAKRQLALLRARQPDLAGSAELGEDLTSEVRLSIVIRKADGRGADEVFADRDSISLPVRDEESTFRVQVEAGEDAYFYMYGVYGDQVVVLFPAAPGEASLPLTAGSAYTLPAKQASYELSRDGARLTQITTVSSRWRARDIEELNARLIQGDREAGSLLLQALKSRQAAGVAGCDVRAASFELAG